MPADIIEEKVEAPRASRPPAGIARSILTLAGGTAAGQAMVVLASPVLTRLYTPADFGLLAVFSAVLMVIVAGASARYEMAIPIAKDERTAIDLVLLSLVLVGCTTLVVAMSSWIADLAIADYAPYAALRPYRWLLILAVAIAGAFQVLQYWFIRIKQFTILARTRFVQGAGQAALQVGLGMLVPGWAFGLVLGDVVGRGLGVTSLWQGFRSARRDKAHRLSTIVGAAREFERFPRVLVWAALLNILASQAPLLLLPMFFGADLAGSYLLAYRTLILPATLIGGAVGQVLFGHAAGYAGDEDRTKILTRRLAITLLAINVPLYTTVLLGASKLFPFVFGPEWGTAGVFARILAPMVLIWSLASPLSTLLVVGDRLGESLLFTVVELLLKVVAVAVAAHFHSAEMAVWLLSISGAVLSVVSLWRFLRVAHLRLQDLARPVGQIVLLNLPLAALLALAVHRLDALLLGGVAAVLAAAGFILSVRFVPEIQWQRRASA